jgi:hypothetical protein
MKPVPLKGTRFDLYFYVKPFAYLAGVEHQEIALIIVNIFDSIRKEGLGSICQLVEIR